MSEKVTAADVRKAGYCLKGCRAWFEDHPDLDYRDFVRNGIDPSVLPQDDAVVQHVLRVKHGR